MALSKNFRGSLNPEALYKLTRRIARETHVSCLNGGSFNVEWRSKAAGCYQALSGWNESRKWKLRNRYDVVV